MPEAFAPVAQTLAPAFGSYPLRQSHFHCANPHEVRVVIVG